MIFVRGVDVRSLPLHSRKTRLVEALKSDTEHIKRVLGSTIPAELDKIQETFNDAVKTGFEGLVLKDPNTRYGTLHA